MNMYSKMVAVAIAAMFMVTVLPVVSASPEVAQIDNEFQDNQFIDVKEESIDYGKVTFTDRSTIVFSEIKNNAYDDGLKNSTSKIRLSDDLAECASNQIAIIDGTWASTQNQKTLMTQTHKLILQGTPVITVSDSPQMLIESNDGGFSSYAADAKIYGICANPITGSQYCMSVVCDDMDEALLRAYNWADNMISENSTTTSSGGDTSNLEWGAEYGGLIVIPNTIYGDARILTTFYRLHIPTGTTNYYYIHYQFQSTTNPVSKTQFVGNDTLTITSRVGEDATYGQYQSIEDYSPKTTVGTTHHNVGLSLNAGMGGVSLIGNVSWSYDVPTPISVRDYTNTVSKTMKLEFGAEKRNGNPVVQPGLVVRCDGSGSGDGQYHAVDEYAIKYWILSTTNPYVPHDYSSERSHIVYTVVPNNI